MKKKFESVEVPEFLRKRGITTVEIQKSPELRYGKIAHTFMLLFEKEVLDSVTRKKKESDDKNETKN